MIFFPKPEKPIEHACERYIDWLQTLKPGAAHRIKAIAARDIAYRNPFHNIHGVEETVAVYDTMMASLKDLKYRVIDHGVSPEGRATYLRWDAAFYLPGEEERQVISGMSELMLDHNGRIAAIVDFWDPVSQLYIKRPVLGRLVRFLRKRMPF